jgi:hypothetical protein
VIDDDVRRDDDDDDARGATVHNAGFGWRGDHARASRRRETVGDDGCRRVFYVAIRTQSDDDSGDVFAGTTAFAAFDVVF